MAWYRIQLSEDEQRMVLADRESHPQAVVRRRCEVLWALHCGLSRQQAAKVANVGLSTAERFVGMFRDGGLEAVRRCGREVLPTSELAAHADVIRCSLEERPARTIAECCQRIKELTGIERQPTQVRHFLKKLGLKWQRVHAIPVPPKKTWRSTRPLKPYFSTSS
jgi:transposase